MTAATKTSNQRAVVFIEPNRMTFYRSDTGLKKMDITPDVIKDMEVLRKEKLPEMIKSFMVQQPVAPGPLTLIITDSLMYTKSFTNEGDQEKQKAVREDYLSNVPFERVVHTEISTSASTVVIATNEDMCLIFARAFEGLGFMVEQAIPATVFTQIKVGQTGPDDAIMQQYLQHIEENKKYNLIAEHRNKMVQHGHQKEQEAAKKTEAKRLPILIGVFGLLLVVLVMLISMSQATSTKPKTTSVNAETPSQTPAPVDEVSPTFMPAGEGFSRQSVSVLIRTSAQSTSKADALKTTLVDAGYTNVETQATTSAITQSVIQVKSTLATEIKSTFLQELKDLTNVPLSEEVTNSPIDGTIQLSDQ